MNYYTSSQKIPENVKEIIEQEFKDYKQHFQYLLHQKTEEILRVSETRELLETIFDNTHMMVAFIDSQFNFIKNK